MDSIIPFLVFLWLCFALAVAAYADGKGRSFGLYFLISLIVSPVIGFLIVAVASSEGSVRVAADSTSVGEGMKKCPECAEVVRAEARKCRFCSFQFPDPHQHVLVPSAPPPPTPPLRGADRPDLGVGFVLAILAVAVGAVVIFCAVMYG
jgi:hypothetical protein